jgi:hypothetical protein
VAERSVQTLNAVIRIRIAAFLFSTSLMSNNAFWIPCRSKALSTVLRSCDTFMFQTAFRGGAWLILGLSEVSREE